MKCTEYVFNSQQLVSVGLIIHVQEYVSVFSRAVHVCTVTLTVVLLIASKLFWP